MTPRTYLILAAALVLFVMGGVVGCQMHAHFNPAEAVPLIGETKTVTVRDTVRVNVPFPVESVVIDTIVITPRKNSDTVKITSNGKTGGNVSRETIKDDTPTLQASGNLNIPITRKVYQGDDFRAVVSGWRPNLDSMTVYPKTVTATITQPVRKKSVISITLGPSAIYDGKQFRAGVGVTAGFTILAR